MRITVLLYFLLLLIAANMAAIRIIWDLQDYNRFKVIFFDVGQGDAVLIKTPYLQNILIDTGPSGEILSRKLAENIPFWMKRIDLFLATHPEYDHIGGVEAVFENYKVLNVFHSGVRKDTNISRLFDKYLDKARNVFLAERGIRVLMDKNGNDFLKIIYPKESFAGKLVESANDYSVVSLAKLSNFKFLFTADISSVVEAKILEDDIAADFLKVPHHGSRTSSSLNFLRQVNPEAAVISAGKGNIYGHPHEEVLGRLDSLGIKTFRTDILGDIVFEF